MVGYIFDANKGETPASLAKQRAVAEAILAGQQTPRNVGEGLDSVGKAILYRRLMSEVTSGEAAGQSHAADIFGGLTGAGVFPAAPSMTPGPAGAAPGVASAAPDGAPTNYRDAIAGIESAGSGDYSAVGPTSKTLGRALGRYQVMEANIGPWSKEALGREVTPQEFLANPKIQDAIFDHKFGSYVQKYGNPQDAASAWFTGGPLSSGAHKRDVLGTTGAAYVEKFNRGLGAPAVAANEALATGQPTQVASLDPSAGMSADPYGRLPATDSRGEDQRAKFRQWNSNPAANEASNAAAIDPALAGVIERAKQIAGTDFVIGSGRRDAATQQKAVDWGWSKTNESDHLGGGAADLWPVDGNGQVIFDPQKQAVIVQAMKQAAQEKGVDIEAGADWSKFQDKPHFGMVGQTPLDNAPIPQARPDIRGAPVQVASADTSIGMPAATGGEVGGLGSPVSQSSLGTLMDKQPIAGPGAVVQALAAANPPAGAPAAPSPVVEALAAAQQPQQAAPASPGVQQVAQAMQPPQQAPAPQSDNLPVMAGGSADAIQPGQAGPSIQQIMQVATDPWASPEQKAMASMMLKQRLDQQDPGNQLDMDYKRAQIAALNAKQDALPDSVVALKERAAAAGLVEGTPEYKNFMVTGGHGPATVINTGDNSSAFAKKSDESAAKRMDDIVTAGQAAPQTMADMQQLVDLGAQIGTGKLADWKSTLGPYAQAAGIDVGGMDEIQAYKAITSRLAPQMRAVGSGSSSDTDVAMFMQSLPNLRNTQGGNEMIANTMKSVAQNKMNAAEIARKAQRGDITWQDADEQISKLPNPYDLFKEFQKQSAKKPTVIDGYTIEEVP